MSSTLHDYLAQATPAAAASLEAAFLRLPEDKRDWQPSESARSSLNLLAECALLNGYTADLIHTRVMSPDKMKNYPDELTAATQLPLEELAEKLKESVALVVEALREVPESDLGIEIQMPWGTMTLAQIMAYPYWNMSYHEGQTNYIASILGVLK